MKPILCLYSAVAGASFWVRFESELSLCGYNVRSYAALSADRYRGARSGFQRLCIRWLIYFWFPFVSVVRIAVSPRSAGPVIHIATTNPFFLPPLIAFFAWARGERAVFLVYDLYPDAFAVAGWNGTQYYHWLIAGVTRFGFRWSSATVFLGERLRKYAESHYGPTRTNSVIPVGADAAPFRKHPPVRRSTEEPIVVVYIGNLGRMHDADTLVGLLQRPLPQNIRLRFFASGIGYADIQRRALRCDADFQGPLDDEAWIQCLRQADVSLITVAAGAERVVMPSKTYSSLAAGQAILAVCSDSSDLAQLVRNLDCGWIVPPGDIERLRATLVAIEADRHALHAKRMNAFVAGQVRYDMTQIAQEWAALLDTLQ